MKFSKGRHFSLISTLFFIFLLYGCSGGSLESSNSIPEADLNLTAPPDIEWIDKPVKLDQLTVSNSIIDILTVYDFHQSFFQERDLFYRAIVDPSIVTPVKKCSNGGKLHISISQDETIGGLSIAYDNCREGDVTRNGRLLYTFEAEDGHLNSSIFRISFDHYSVRVGDDNPKSYYGSIISNLENRPQVSVFDLTLTYSENLSVRLENLTAPLRKETSEGDYTGRVFDSQLGYYDINLTNGFDYEGSSFWPVSGGSFEITGLDSNASLEIVESDTIYVEITQGDHPSEALHMSWGDLYIGNIPSFGNPPSAKFESVHLEGEELVDSSSIMLDASSSSDPENKLLTYQWSIISGPSGHGGYFDDHTSPRPNFLPNRIGTYAIQLIVSDGLNESTPYIATVELDSLHGRPRARSGYSQELEDVILDYTISDVPVTFDASISYMSVFPHTLSYIDLTYHWRIVEAPEGSGATFSNTDAAITTFTADIEGIYKIGLTVNDGLHNSIEQVYRFDVKPYVHYLPRVFLGSHPYGYVNQEVYLRLSGDSVYGPRATEANWRLISSPEGSSVSNIIEDGLRFWFEADIPGEYQFEVIANSDTTEGIPKEFTIYIDSAPIFEEQVILDNSVNPNFDYRYKRPRAIYASDTNKDNSDDLVVLTNSGLSILPSENNGDSFKATVTEWTFDRPKSGISELDNFGNNSSPDIFFSDIGKHEIWDISLDSPPELSWSIPDPESEEFIDNLYELLIVDFNGDGLKDLVNLMSPGSYDDRDAFIQLHFNQIGDSPNMLHPINIDLPPEQLGWLGIQSADINEDGYDDLVATSTNLDIVEAQKADFLEGINKIFYFPNDGSGNFSASMELNYSESPIYFMRNRPYFHDIDGDGDLDLIGRTSNVIGEIGISVWLQDDEGSFNLTDTNPVYADFYTFNADQLKIADFDMDGLDDIALVENQRFQILLQTSAGHFTTGQSYDLGITTRSFFSLADIDKDGDVDVYLTRYGELGPEIVEYKNLTIH